MYNMRRLIGLILIMFSFIVLHNPIMTGVANITSLFRKDNSHDLEISAYKEKIESLEKSIFEYESAMENLKIYDGSSFVLGKIALRDTYDFYDYLIISTDTKVSVGSPIINEDGLVGLIEESNKKTAKVELLTGDVSISVSVSGAYGMLDGYDKKENTFLIHNINNYTKIDVGDEVTTSGLQKIDAGLHIGYVTKVETIGVENIVHVAPSVEYDNLNYVMVIDR